MTMPHVYVSEQLMVIMMVSMTVRERKRIGNWMVLGFSEDDWMTVALKAAQQLNLEWALMDNDPQDNFWVGQRIADRALASSCSY